MIILIILRGVIKILPNSKSESGEILKTDFGKLFCNLLLNNGSEGINFQSLVIVSFMNILKLYLKIRLVHLHHKKNKFLWFFEIMSPIVKF